MSEPWGRGPCLLKGDLQADAPEVSVHGQKPRVAPMSAPAPGLAHVGIMLYGASGLATHRHLDGDGAFQRNSLDVFQIRHPTQPGPPVEDPRVA